MFFAHIPHVLVVAISKTFVFFVWIIPTMLAWIFLNVDMFTDFNSVFLVEARITNDSVPSGVERIVEQISVADQMSPLCLDLDA